MPAVFLRYSDNQKIPLTTLPNTSRGGPAFSPSVLPTYSLVPICSNARVDSSSFLIQLFEGSQLAHQVSAQISEGEARHSRQRAGGWGDSLYNYRGSPHRGIFWINQPSPSFININQPLLIARHLKKNISDKGQS